MILDFFLRQQLEKRRLKGNYRRLKVNNGLVDFTSNDYLGFARTNRWNERLKKLGSTGSRLLTGNNPEVEELENHIAAFHGAEAGLIFNSGYTANLGLLSSIIQPDDAIVFDLDCHASSQDGMRLSKAQLLPFRHQDVDHLENRLKQSKRRTFVCIESVYSCNGSMAAMNEICILCQRYGAHLIVDEAHATGILGPQGQGLCFQHNCEKQVFARIHTFSKALGSHGAIILGNSLLKEYLINFCRPFIYTTALPFPILASIKNAYERLTRSSKERKGLNELISDFKAKAQVLGLAFTPSNTPIQCLIVPGNERIQTLSKFLQSQGFDVRALMSPTVRQGEERLRICLHAFNTKEEIKLLFKCLADAIQEGVLPCAR